MLFLEAGSIPSTTINSVGLISEEHYISSLCDLIISLSREEERHRAVRCIEGTGGTGWNQRAGEESATEVTEGHGSRSSSSF